VVRKLIMHMHARLITPKGVCSGLYDFFNFGEITDISEIVQNTQLQ